MTHVHFPQSGVISIVDGSGESGVETSIVGRSGFLGLSVLLGGAGSIHGAGAQISGETKRMPAELFVRLLRDAPGLRGLLYRYAYAQLETVQQLASCNVLHVVEQRCARWLLMATDQADDTPYYLTQAFLAQMLGVRRAGVAAVAGLLQQAGFIEYHRGRMTLLDRPALEQVACRCYGVIRGITDQLFASV
jgi:CRP-like cAMP-binding protein